MKPFDDYPGDGKTLLRKRRGANTRREDAPELMSLTGAHTCAFCGEVDFRASYGTWLLVTLDHAVPRGECERLGVPIDMQESFSNAVLACSGCNGLDNRYRAERATPKKVWSLAEFVRFRDRVFEERKPRVLAARQADLNFFASKPWSMRTTRRG